MMPEEVVVELIEDEMDVLALVLRDFAEAQRLVAADRSRQRKGGASILLHVWVERARKLLLRSFVPIFAELIEVYGDPALVASERRKHVVADQRRLADTRLTDEEEELPRSKSVDDDLEVLARYPLLARLEPERIEIEQAWLSSSP